MFLTRSILWVVGLATSILTARILGPEGRGILGIAVTIYGIGVQFGNFGINSANIYYVSKNPVLAPRALGNSLLVVFVAFALSILYFGFCVIFPSYSLLGNDILFLAVLFIPIMLFNMFQQNIFVALNKIQYYNIFELFNALLYPSLLLVLVFNNYVKTHTVLIASLAAQLVTLIIAFKVLKNMLQDKICFDAKLFKQFVPYGIKSYVACFLAFLVLRVDILLLGYFCGSNITGQYAVAVSLADMANMITQSVGIIFLPHIAKMATSIEKHILAKKVVFITIAILATALAVGLPMSGFLIPLLYGKDFIASIGAFRLLLIGVFLLAPANIFENYYAGLGKINFSIYARAIGLIVNLLLNFILIPAKGMLGAAISSIISYAFISLIYSIIFIAEEFRLNSQREDVL